MRLHRNIRFVIYVLAVILSFTSFSNTKKPPGKDDIGEAREEAHHLVEKLPEGLQIISVINQGTVQSITFENFFTKTLEFLPRNSADIIEIVRFATSSQGKKLFGNRKLVTGSGNWTNPEGTKQGLSIGSHAQGQIGDIYVSTMNLKKKHLSEKKDYSTDQDDETITFWVGGGNSWKEAMDLAHQTLSPEEQKKYQYVPLSAPTSQVISIAGTLTSHGHSRSSAFGGGYMPDSVKAFRIVMEVGGVVKEVELSPSGYADLFHAIPGSFGRGGIITEVKLTLQKIPLDFLVVTKINQYKDPKLLLEDFKELITIVRKRGLRMKPFQRPFNSAYVTATDNYYYLYSSQMKPKKEAEKYPYFHFFESPGHFTDILQSFGQVSTNLANKLIDIFHVGPKGKKTYKNHPVSWIFVQDSYLRYLHSSRYIERLIFRKPPMLAHQAYVFPEDKLEEILQVFNSVRVSYKQKYNLTSKMLDLLPLPASRFVMTPAYKATQSQYILTITWPIGSKEEREVVREFKKDFLDAASAEPKIGKDVIRPHMLKEFNNDSSLLSQVYARQITEFENVLIQNKIRDHYLSNGIIRNLYQNRLPASVQNTKE